MSFFVRKITSPAAGDRGTSMVEYALLVALIAIVSFAAMGSVGSGTGDQFETIAVGLGAEAGDVDPATPGEQSPDGDDESAQDEDEDEDYDAGGGGGGGGDETGDIDHEQAGDPSGDGQGSDQDPDDEAADPGDDGSDGDDGSGDGSESGGDNGDGGAGDVEEETEPEVPAEPGSTLAGSSTASSFYWWNADKKGGEGAWKASVTYENDWIRHQYLVLEVTRVDDRGRTSVSTVDSFYVPAGGSSTFDLWNNELSVKNGKATGTVSVSVKVKGIKTSDEAWKTVTFPGDGTESVIDAPTTP